jgi:hypothetical protein
MSDEHSRIRHLRHRWDEEDQTRDALNVRPNDPTVADFLRCALAKGARAVPTLEAMARAAGLLGERQRITDAKLFKRAKRSLGIRSVRNGFGSGGEWLWALEVERRFPLEWQSGVDSLKYYQPADIPPHRWRQFLCDCDIFLASHEKGAARAAELGWDAQALFGCHRSRPLMHLGSAGLLWAINGGRLLSLHKDWAVIERAADGSQRVFHRRTLDAANVTLPWIGLRQRSR